MKARNTYIRSAEVLLPLGAGLDAAFDAMDAGRCVWEYRGVGPEGKRFPCMAFTPEQKKAIGTEGVSFLDALLAKVSQMLLQKMALSSFPPDTQLVFCTTKADIEAPELLSKQLWHTAAKLAQQLGLLPEPIVVSSACISGVSGVTLAAQYIRGGVCERALVLGADLLTDFVLSGFYSFKAMSAELCRPYDASRDGLNLGEGAAAIYLDTQREGALAEVLGYAQSNDANHISGPSRTGEGLAIAVRNALQQAQTGMEQIDFISAHGTATPYNDEMESLALESCAAGMVPVTGFKAFTGHTLGAAGVIELAFCLESMQRNRIIPNPRVKDPDLGGSIYVNHPLTEKPVNKVLKTASGFGGCNAAIVIGKIC